MGAVVERMVRVLVLVLVVGVFVVLVVLSPEAVVVEVERRHGDLFSDQELKQQEALKTMLLNLLIVTKEAP